MIDFADRAREIRAQYLRDEYILRIKELVRQQLRDLDPQIQLHDTHYFNHSAIPDFVVTHPGDRQRRDFFIRSSYASIVAAEDVSHAEAAPSVFLALDDTQRFDSELPRIGPEEIAREAQSARQALVTDVAAVATIGASDQESASPLSSLVREHFVSGGRGWVDQDRAETLVGVARGAGAADLNQVVRQNFNEASALRMQRTAALVEVALSPGVNGEALEEALSSMTGLLSPAEMRTLIPWLLNNVSAERADRFWRLFAPLVTLTGLQAISSTLDHLDITLLVRPNVKAGRPIEPTWV